MQRLVNVADKVNEETERVVDLGVTQSGGNDTLSVVCNSTKQEKQKDNISR